jgi:hypothetical protein
MNQLICAALMTATLAAAPGAAFADEHIRETRNVDARVLKVKLGSVIDLVLKQGQTPSLVVSGEQRDVAKVTTVQTGDTLVIDTEKDRGMHFGRNRHEQLRAELTLPNLNELVSQGVGATVVTGFTGETVRLALNGAGSVTVTSRYKNVDAHLGGVGSMTLNSGDSERVDLSLSGAGEIAINGQTRLLRAKLGGVGSLGARALRADTVELDMTGLGGATVYASNTANLTLSGLGSATVYGKPAMRNATARGLGSVKWE